MERKLAAIFSTDVKGYSRLMGDDEEATIHTLKTYREVISGLIEQHHGRVVDSPGDNLLAEFASAVDAVKSAVAIQHELKMRNAELEAHRKMEFRIGLNVGDVITDEGRLYGDGVNIAARLEGLADPGGICLSGNVHEQVRNKLTLTYDYIGEREVKNIANPVPVYKVQLESDGTAPQKVSNQRPVPSRVQESGPSRRLSMAALAVVIVLVAGAGGLVFRNFSPLLSPPAETALPLPDKPSIAVLPFTNMSTDPEQEYFSDGLTDTLITDLSKLSGLFVIARNSVFNYKGQAVKPTQVSRELGVRYLMEGSVQKAETRVRINAQLIDATTGGHLWTERYDRELTDLFALQDEITQEIIRALRIEVQAAERDRVRRIPTDNFTAYDAWLRGVEYFWRTTKDDTAQARQLFERAIELDPQYADAYVGLGLTYWQEWGWWNQDAALLERAGEFAQHALTLDDSLSDAHSIMGFVYLYQKKQPEQAIAQGAQAMVLDPNSAIAVVMQADILTMTGRPEEAIGLVQQAMRLNPRYVAYYPYTLGVAYHLTGQNDEAIVALKEALRLAPNDPGAYAILAESYLSLWTGQWSQDPQTLERAVEAAQQAVALSDSIPWAHGTLSSVYLWQKRHEEARAEAERAVALDPNDAFSHAYLGNVLNFVGRPEDTRERMKHLTCSTAFYYPTFCFSVLGEGYYLTKQYEEAITAFRQALTHKPLLDLGLAVHLGLAASYSEMGRAEEARAEIAEVLHINPQFSLAEMQQRLPYQDPGDLERFVAALGEAGLK